jgi:hypothetical protein
MTDDGTAAAGRPPRLGIPFDEAARHVEHLGFLDVNGTAPQAPGGSNLVVALRERPTLVHFDPERVEHWVAEGGRGRLAEISRKPSVPPERRFLWGTIKVFDRLEVFNSFLTFGGTVRVVERDSATMLVVFSSHAPILRSTGHSQAVDLSTGEVGAFFARMMIPIDFTPGAEARITASAPMAIYAAFHASMEARFDASEELRASHPAFAAWCRRERRRLAALFGPDWEAGRALATELGLAGR